MMRRASSGMSRGANNTTMIFPRVFVFNRVGYRGGAWGSIPGKNGTGCLANGKMWIEHILYDTIFPIEKKTESICIHNCNVILYFGWVSVENVVYLVYYSEHLRFRTSGWGIRDASLQHSERPVYLLTCCHVFTAFHSLFYLH